MEIKHIITKDWEEELLRNIVEEYEEIGRIVFEAKYKEFV